MTRVQILELVIQSLPCPEQMAEIDLETITDCIQFTGRGERFRVSSTLSVERVKEPGFVTHDNICILMERVLKLVKFGLGGGA